MVSPNTSQLKKENDKLKVKVNEISKELEELKERVRASDNMAANSSAISMEEDLGKSLEKSVQFLSDECDESKGIVKSLKSDFDRISSKLRCIEDGLTKVEEAIESINQYSYQYNLKILGVPQEKSFESSRETADICLKIFNEIGAKVVESDIDIAHRLEIHLSKKKNIICSVIYRQHRHPEDFLTYFDNAIEI